eukprot:536560_1
MSVKGHFVECICQSFGRNAKQLIKIDFMSLLVEIGRNLEKSTNGAAICTTSGIGTIRYNQIRFEVTKNYVNKNNKTKNAIEMAVTLSNLDVNGVKNNKKLSTNNGKSSENIDTAEYVLDTGNEDVGDDNDNISENKIDDDHVINTVNGNNMIEMISMDNIDILSQHNAELDNKEQTSDNSLDSSRIEEKELDLHDNIEHSKEIVKVNDDIT